MIKFSDWILFEDPDYIIINKPFDISTLEDRDQTKPYVLKLAKLYVPQAQVCHRLDKETSGILVIAKHPKAYKHLSLQFEHREVIKIYHAVVLGTQNLENQMVDMPIHTLNDGVVKIDYQKGKASATLFNTLQTFSAGYSLVACVPITGRMHQIRVHLSAIRRPIVSDTVYGGHMLYLSKLKRGYKSSKHTDEQPLMKRVALHAQAITYKSLSGQQNTVVAPYPRDFQALIRQLQIHSADTYKI